MTVNDFFYYCWPWSHVIMTVIIPFLIIDAVKIRGYCFCQSCHSCSNKECTISFSLLSITVGNLICCFPTVAAHTNDGFTNPWSLLLILIPVLPLLGLFLFWLSAGGKESINKAIRLIGRLT